MVVRKKKENESLIPSKEEKIKATTQNTVTLTGFKQTPNF